MWKVEQRYIDRCFDVGFGLGTVVVFEDILERKEAQSTAANCGNYFFDPTILHGINGLGAYVVAAGES